MTRELKIPKGKKLFPYQAEGVHWILDQPHNRILLADEMGLGKTIQAIVVANHWKPQHIVVIAPAIMLHTWEREFKLWYLQCIPEQLVTAGKAKLDPDARLTIISYNLASKNPWVSVLASLLQKRAPSMLIIDEAHYLKSWRTQRTNNILNHLVPRASKILAMTGTPFVKSVEDLHPLAFMCTPPPPHQPLEDVDTFAERYAYAQPTPWGRGIEYRGLKAQNLPELKKRFSSFMIRRFKKDVEWQLPKRIYTNIILDIPAKEARQALEDAEKLKEEMQKMRDAAKKGKARRLNTKNYATVRHELGLIKLKPIYGWLEDFLEQKPNEKIVIFAIHRSVVESLYAQIRKWKLSVEAITGVDSPKQKQKVIDSFQAGHTQILICNIIAAGIGITLTKARTVVFAELSWSVVEVEQAIARVHRIGQKRRVQIFFMLAKDSLDEVILEVLRRKIDIEKQIVGAKKKSGRTDKHRKQALRAISSFETIAEEV